jgi:UDP-MurNAc hydroxylase
MNVQLISHASVVIRSDIAIWTDPWLFGKAFNDSWSLFPAPVFDESLYSEIDYIFISHEHPDHFHIPTLRAMPDEFKQRVTVLYQENNSDKMSKAFNKFGFPNVMLLPHRKLVRLTEKTQVYCYLAGSMDSLLGVLYEDHVLLNVNDCEINSSDCRRISHDIGKADLALNQFSIAGYNGHADREKHLPPQAQNILDKMLRNHNDLSAKATVPFASFVYFSSADNCYINEYANKPRNAYEYFKQNSKEMTVLYPGESLDVGGEHDTEASLIKYDDAYTAANDLEYDDVQSATRGQIDAAFAQLSAHIRDHYPGSLLRALLKPVVVRVPDLDQTLKFSIATGEICETDESPDLIIRSQPLYFAFAFPYGVQTLGVSARYTLLKNFPNWRNHRVLFSLNNAELYLSPKHFFTSQNLAFLAKRLPGAWNQLTYRLKLMR